METEQNNAGSTRRRSTRVRKLTKIGEKLEKEKQAKAWKSMLKNTTKKSAKALAQQRKKDAALRARTLEERKKWLTRMKTITRKRNKPGRPTLINKSMTRIQMARRKLMS